MNKPADAQEPRYAVISALLQADGPLALEELAAHLRLPHDAVARTLQALAQEGLVASVAPPAGEGAPRYVWAARWGEAAQRRAARGTEQLLAALAPHERDREARADLEGEAARSFCRYVTHDYQTPPGKRFLVVFQCSVRRPFSSSPSHATMRRPIRLATGYDPRHDFAECPVHVVVLASYLGPVPYELEDVYPANVRGGGVKHMSWEQYARAKPILAARMAEYLVAHRQSYERVTTFTEGRYAEVMEEARRLARARGVPEFFVLPDLRGPRVVHKGQPYGRTYWDKFWVQVFLEVTGWLSPAERRAAQARFEAGGWGWLRAGP